MDLFLYTLKMRYLNIHSNLVTGYKFLVGFLLSSHQDSKKKIQKDIKTDNQYLLQAKGGPCEAK